jgi:DNA-binding NtrC family response regulator
MATSRLTSARLEQLLQQAREPAFWLSPQLRLIWVNRAWEALTGYPAGAVSGLICRAHGPTKAGDLPGLGGSFYPPAEALDGRPSATRTLIVLTSGERIWRRVEYWPFHNDEGELLAILGLVRTLDEPPVAGDSENHRLRVQLMEVRDRALARHGTDSLIGQGPAHRRLLDQVEAASASQVPVLVVGETGTGKRLVARTIHGLGSGRQAPLVAFDCSALPHEVLERELFGGSETSGDSRSRTPRLALPEGSSVVITEVFDLPRDLQGPLVDALDQRVRLIATSTVDPEAALQAERLRPDLYYRLTSLVIRLRPLRDRLEELPLLAQHFLERANQRGGRQRSGFHEDALKTLIGYDWPGNLREFARVIDDAHGQGEHDAVFPDDLPAAIRGHLGAAYLPPNAPTLMPMDELLTQVERRLIESTLARVRHNKSRAAEFLGISRPRLYRRIKELGIPDEPEPRDDAVEHP